MSSLLSSWLNAASPGPIPYILDNYHIGLMALVVIILLCVSAVFTLIGIIFQGFGVYTLARRRGYMQAKTAFIPVAGYYVLGGIYDDINRCENKESNYRIWLVFWSALSTIIWTVWLFAFFIFLLSGRILVYFQGYVDSFVRPLLIVLLVAILVQAITFTIKNSVLQGIFKDYEPENAILFTVLAAFFSFLIPYLLFSIRGKPSLSISRAQFIMKSEDVNLC